jgi:hypothetical protein
MSGYHAAIAPSSLHLTVECQAWLGLTLKMDKDLLALMTADTPASLEGNAADWVAKEYAKGNEVAYGTPTPVPGILVNYDMIHGAKLWRDEMGYGAVMDLPVVCERIHPTDCWGVPDGWRWDPIAGVLKLLDYKYGFDIHDVFEHWQLIGYLAGILDTMKLRASQVMVEFVIVQPRAFHKDGPVRRWKIQADMLTAQINIAHSAAIATLPPKPEWNGKYEGYTAKAKSGAHCLHCPARPVCGTFQAAVSEVLEMTGKPVLSAMDHNAVGVQLALVHSAAKLLKAQETALEAQAEAMLRAGKRVPNYTMEPSAGAYKWNPDASLDEVMGLGALANPPINMQNPGLNVNSRCSPVMTPTQATKAGLPDAIVKHYATSFPGAMKLAPENLTEARRAFGDINT